MRGDAVNIMRDGKIIELTLQEEAELEAHRAEQRAKQPPEPTKAEKITAMLARDGLTLSDLKEALK
jgi:hypothetical protein